MALSSPFGSCNNALKKFFYQFDCRKEFQEQVHFMKTAKEYFISHTIVEVMQSDYSLGGNPPVYLRSEPNSSSESDCKNTLPLPDIMKQSDKWLLPITYLKYYWENGFFLNIIFIHNITSEEEHYINKQIERDLKRDNRLIRFFILQFSETNIKTDYIYYTPSFKDLNIVDIFPKMCNLDEGNYSVINSGEKYLNSTYYIANQLQSLDNKIADFYCGSRKASKLLSLETYDEVIYIFEIIMSLFAHYSTREINIHIGLRKISYYLVWIYLHSRYSFFVPSNYTFWKGCFYLKIIDTKNVRLLADDFYNSGNSLELIDCKLKLPNTLEVCETPDTRLRLFNQFDRIAQEKWVVDSDYFSDFINKIFDSSNYPKISIFNGSRCIEKRNYTKSLLESYLCGNDLINNVENLSIPDNMIRLIYTLSEEHDGFYILTAVDISKCYNYNKCQATMAKESVDSNSSTNVLIYCLDKGDIRHVNSQCSAHVISLRLGLEYFQCKSNKDQHFYKCIKDPKGQCSDNSNLLHCENFTCPEPFFKCQNSYCVFPFLTRQGNFDCPTLEQDVIPVVGSHIFEPQLSFVFREMCIDSTIFNDLLALRNKSFVCKYICPKNYKCVSSRTESKDGNKISTEVNVSYYTMSLPLFNVSFYFYAFFQGDNTNNFFPFISFVEFIGRDSNVCNFDQGFQNWRFNELLILDLSFNSLIHSNNLKSIESFSKLKYLNLSHNENLVIDHNFTFPRLLEIIDLSYTKISSLKSEAFYNLTYLIHLNLSFTLINKFKGMGIPNYFKLDTLFIEGFLSEYLEIDFFRGLTIELELRASDFVICCPQVLNPNIDVAKCYAPLDIISTCKHLVGDTFKRIVIWIVGILTFVGNCYVLVYRIGWNREIFKRAYGFFVTGLAVSDLIMGAYLIIIASVDTFYKDVYVVNDFAWRNGFMCQLLGILSTLSSETSTFFICLITLDRFFSITYPFGEHRFSKTSTLISFTLVWLVCFVLALVPVTVAYWEIYSSNGLCLALPFSSTQYKGWIFSFLVFVVLNFVLFLFIVVGQLTIFINLIRNNKSNERLCKNSQRRDQERTVALKLSFVALTDFCCWFPVGILGILSLYGHIFNREVYAWIAVFVLPINSSLNPVIYTLPALYSLCKKYI